MKDLLDDRNIDLWNKIDSTYRVIFEKSSNDEYGCFSKGNEVTFYVGKGELSKDSFTHEMLHVYFRLNDCFLGPGLLNILVCNNRLGKILSAELMEHIGNCFEHVKMLPLYLDMGFEKLGFLTDFHEHKCRPIELQFFKDQYIKNRKINTQLVDPFIGKLVAMLCDPNDELKYEIELEEFKKLDSSLFYSIEFALDLWKSIDIEGDDIISTNYHDVIFDLENDLENWYEENL